MELRFVRDKGIFIEELDIVNGILDSFVAPGAKSMEEIELWKSHWIWY